MVINRCEQPVMMPKRMWIATVEGPSREGRRGGQSPSGQLHFIGAETRFFRQNRREDRQQGCSRR